MLAKRQKDLEVARPTHRWHLYQWMRVSGGPAAVQCKSPVDGMSAHELTMRRSVPIRFAVLTLQGSGDVLAS